MERERQLMASLITAIVAVGILTISTSVHAIDTGSTTGMSSVSDTSATAMPSSGSVPATTSAMPQELEKCYGVVKAGQNDCDTNMGSCVPSVIDASPTEWIYLPKGICSRLVGGTTNPSGAMSNTPSANPLPDAAVMGTTGVVGGASIDSAPIMKDTTILDGGAGLKGGNTNTDTNPTNNTNNSGSELNKY